MPQENCVAIRTYRDGDEQRVSELFARCYSAYSGYAVRTPQFWKWFNVLRAGGDNVLVATIEEKVVGCLTVCYNGEILDPCYDPERDGEAIMAALLEAAEIHARRKGIEAITVDIPPLDDRMRAACRNMAMRRKGRRRALSARVMDHRRFLKEVLSRTRPPEGVYRMEIAGRRGGSTTLVFSITHGAVTVAPEGDREGAAGTKGTGPELTITIDEETLNSIVFAGKMTLADWLRRRIVVTPARHIMRGRALLKSFDLGLNILLLRGGVF